MKPPSVSRRWTVACHVTALLAAFVAISPGGAGAKEVTVRSEIEKGPHYVGGTIAAAVSVVAGADRPSVTAPRVEGVEIHASGMSIQPIATSAIGNLVDQSNRYIFRFHLVPRQPGLKVIGPFVAKNGTQTGGSAPLRLEVRNIPSAGRPGSFLGGVGTLFVDAQAQPPSIRLGQELEYRVIVRGPGARGSTRPLTPPRLARSSLAPRIRELPIEVSDEPPTRVFRYQVRPTRPGEDVFPPVSVSWFEPATGRYLTKVSPAVPVRVSDVPRFESQDLTYRIPEQSGFVRRLLLPLSIGGGGVLLAAGMLAWARRSRVRRRLSAGQIAEKLLLALESSEGPEDMAKRITDGFADYLHVAVGRPTGVLTPAEASRDVMRFTGNSELAEEAGRLIAACDRVRFEASAAEVGRTADEQTLAGRSRALLRKLRDFRPGPENAARGFRDT